MRRSQRAERGPLLVEIDLGVALIGCNDKSMPVRELEQYAPTVKIEHASRRIVRRAQVQQLRTRPDGIRNRAPWMREAGFRIGVDAIRFGAREQRCTLVDLVKRIGYHDGCAWTAGIDDGLREREQSLAAAQDGQYLSRGIKRRQMMPCPKPTRDRLAQLDSANRRGIMRESRR